MLEHSLEKKKRRLKKTLLSKLTFEYFLQQLKQTVIGESKVHVPKLKTTNIQN